eukprot:1159756-Pelagomonas_calceolata.AAC.18
MEDINCKIQPGQQSDPIELKLINIGWPQLRARRQKLQHKWSDVTLCIGLLILPGVCPPPARSPSGPPQSLTSQHD